jgi:hypothetical protein
MVCPSSGCEVGTCVNTGGAITQYNPGSASCTLVPGMCSPDMGVNDMSATPPALDMCIRTLDAHTTGL